MGRATSLIVLFALAMIIASCSMGNDGSRQKACLVTQKQRPTTTWGPLNPEVFCDDASRRKGVLSREGTLTRAARDRIEKCTKLGNDGRQRSQHRGAIGSNDWNEICHTGVARAQVDEAGQLTLRERGGDVGVRCCGPHELNS